MSKELTEIGKSSFSKTIIKSITIPPNVVIICEKAFQLCESLKEVNISEDSKLDLIDEESFTEIDIEKIFIPASVTKINGFAFHKCKNLSNVTFQSNSKLSMIGTCAFSFTNVRNIQIPEKVTIIDESSFGGSLNIFSFEFLGEKLMMKSYCFEDSIKMILASFPNAKEIALSHFTFINVSKDISFFFLPGAKIAQDDAIIYN